MIDHSKIDSFHKSAVGGILRRGTERSFTLIETIIALGLLTFLVLEVASVQGNAIFFVEYGRNVVQASALAQRVMSQVEYQWSFRDFKQMEQDGNVKEQAFEDMPDFKFSLEIKEWKLPLIDMLAGGKEDEDGKTTGGNPMIKAAAAQVLGSDMLKTVFVEVFWTEGAKRNSTTLTYLLTNQKKVDEAIGQLKALSQAAAAPGAGKSTPPPGGGAPPVDPPTGTIPGGTGG